MTTRHEEVPVQSLPDGCKAKPISPQVGTESEVIVEGEQGLTDLVDPIRNVWTKSKNATITGADNVIFQRPASRLPLVEEPHDTQRGR